MGRRTRHDPRRTSGPDLRRRLRPDLPGARWDEQVERTQTDFELLLERHRGEIRRADLPRAAAVVASF